MSSNIFFKRKNIKVNKIFQKINFIKNFTINDVKPLHTAKINDITFLDTTKYKSAANLTKASICITTENREHREISSRFRRIDLNAITYY